MMLSMRVNVIIGTIFATAAAAALAKNHSRPNANDNTDPCQPHGETNVLNNGSCWGAGGEGPGCFSCFYGPQCKEYNASMACLVDASRNSFLLWQSYFEPQHFPTSPVLPASWAMPYQAADVGGAVPPFATAIRNLHKMAGNMNPDGVDGQNLLLCSGARACALAVLYAINQVYGPMSNEPLQVFSRAPYFTLYPIWVPLAGTGKTTDAIWNASANPSLATTIELMASPNNPDGNPQRPIVQNKSRVICDQVYNWGWNHYPAANLDCDVSIFSMSKATGHCATRVGWAFIKDDRIFQAANEYTLFTAGGVSVEGQARSLEVVERIVATNGSFFSVARAILESRWDALDTVLPACITSGLLTTYNKQHRGPLLWLTAPTSKDGLAMLAVAGILGETGTHFGAPANNARLNLCISNSSWELVLPRLRQLCSSSPTNVWERAALVNTSHFVSQSIFA